MTLLKTLAAPFVPLLTLLVCTLLLNTLILLKDDLQTFSDWVFCVGGCFLNHSVIQKQEGIMDGVLFPR